MAVASATSVDPTRLESWLQIRPDNSVAIRSGVADFGQGAVSTSFRQLVAEELRIPFEAVSELVTGDTDRTPDGGIAAMMMVRPPSMAGAATDVLHPDSPFGSRALNLQKAAAYAYAALIERASRVLGVPPDALAAKDGVISSGSNSVTYAELVRQEPLDVRLEVVGQLDALTGISVLGHPPVVPVSEWRVIGQSCPNPRIPPIVTGTMEYAGDVRIPGMLHGRVVHPKTLGSTLLSVGELDTGAFPGAEVVVRGNLVAVVSADEWEAVSASRALALTTTWSEWQGLPGNEGLVEAMLEADWSATPAKSSADGEGDIDAVLSGAAQTVNAFYMLPYYKHAPIGPEVAVAHVRSDGTTHVWSSSQQLQSLRGKLATMLGTDTANVIVHFSAGAAGFGRTNKGDGGPEAEAVVISQACGKPVRLQWSREEDFGWSTQQSPYLGEVSVGLDEAGRMVALKAEHHNPGVDADPTLGAALAGLPIVPGDPQRMYVNRVWVEWPYDRVENRLEHAYGAPNFGQAESPINSGLRHRSMRSPQHLQQSFAIESMVNEAAAAAGADPIQFRLDHTSDERLAGTLEAVRKLSGWQTRPSPAPDARSTGGGIVHGRGLGVAMRHGTYLAAVAEIAVDLDSGSVAVERYWLAADVGLVVNPRLVQLNLEGGSAMGISQALHEELQFNASSVTSTDFRSYPILKMSEMPEIEIEIVTHGDTMAMGQASEPSNMPPFVALAAAFFDATGKTMRRLPMRPGYVQAELRDG